jgi:hypothetical protein
MDEDQPATISDAIREYGTNAGGDKPEHPWILTPWDVWVRNPAYTGPEVRHPEVCDD